MQRRTFLRGLAASIVLRCGFTTSSLYGDEPEGSFAKTLAWYTAMFRPLEVLAETVDRLRLIRYLRGLELACDGIVDGKGDVIALLKEAPVDRKRLSVTLVDLQQSIDGTRSSLRQVRGVLRERFSQMGADASAELTDVLVGRKSWVERLKMSLDNHSDVDLAATFLSSAKASLDDLTAVNLKLADLVTYLKRQVPEGRS